MLFIRLIENSVEAGMLILVVMVITFLLRHAPKIYSYILWVMVFAWMLVPIRIPMTVGILPEVSLEGMLDMGMSDRLLGGEGGHSKSESPAKRGR